MVERKMPEGKKRITLDLDEEIINAIKATALINGIKPNQLVAEWAREKCQEQIKAAIAARKERKK